MIANDYKAIADAVHYKSENVQMFLKVVKGKAAEGHYWMPRFQRELPLTDNEVYYLKSEGFYITPETIRWLW